MYGKVFFGRNWLETRETKLPRWQHGNVSASLSFLDTCPFAVSMRAAHRVLVLTVPWQPRRHGMSCHDVSSASYQAPKDHSADTLERCWVVFEAALAHELGKAERVGDRLGKGVHEFFLSYVNDFVSLLYNKCFYITDFSFNDDCQAFVWFCSPDSYWKVLKLTACGHEL